MPFSPEIFTLKIICMLRSVNGLYDQRHKYTNMFKWFCVALKAETDHPGLAKLLKTL